MPIKTFARFTSGWGEGNRTNTDLARIERDGKITFRVSRILPDAQDIIDESYDNFDEAFVVYMNLIEKDIANDENSR